MASALTGRASQDRRGATRFVPGARALPGRARLKHGPEVAVVDLSTTGVLIEGRCRLRPGGAAGICLDLANGEETFPCRVVRCHVFAVNGREGVCYRAALAFERPLALNFDAGGGE